MTLLNQDEKVEMVEVSIQVVENHYRVRAA